LIEYIVDEGILEFILLFIVEDDAFVIDKVKDGDPPNGAAEKLDHKLVHPFL
jgi:hypothetical protein